MTTALVLGASGMLGHKMIQILDRNKISVAGTVRSKTIDIEFLKNYNIVGNVNAENFDSVKNAIELVDPDYVINCIGIIKQLPESNNPIKSHTMNSVLPHQLATYCTSCGMMLIHISSDCVFDGKVGMYRETDVPNATDIYGRTKFTGEVYYKPHLTLRTSIIGRELSSKNGLLEWFLSQKHKSITGYKNAIFSGVTTIELSHLVSIIIKDYNWLSGLYHVASTPISKYDLLYALNDAFNNDTTIKEYYGEVSDRSLSGLRLKKTIQYEPPAWKRMIEEIANDGV